MARRRDRGLPPPVGPPGVNPNPGGYMSEDHQWEGNYNRRGRGVSNRVSGNSATRTRRNRNCCDGWEHQMRGGQWMCGSYHGACEGQMHRGTHMGNNQDSVDVIWPWPSTPPDGPIIPPVLSTGGGHTGNQGHDVNVVLPWPFPRPWIPQPGLPVIKSQQSGGGGQGNETRVVRPPWPFPRPWIPQPGLPVIRGQETGGNQTWECESHMDCGLGLQCVEGQCVGGGGPMPPPNGYDPMSQNQGTGGHQILPIRPGNQNQGNQTRAWRPPWGIPMPHIPQPNLPVRGQGGAMKPGNQGHDVNVIWPWPNNPPDGPIIPPVLSTGGGNTGQGWCNTHSDCPPGMSCNENGQCIPSNPGPGPMPGGNGGRY